MPQDLTVKSATRVLELLDFFAEWRRPATVKEISTTLGYPQSSTSVLLKSLTSSGYFDYDARTRMYIPNVRVALSTSWIEQSLFSENSLLRLMESILAVCGHTTIISAQHGTKLQYVHLLPGTRPNRVAARIGVFRFLYKSAPGKMLLTTKPEREVVSMLNRVNGEEAASAKKLNAEKVLDELRLCRQRGYATSFNEAVPDAGAVAILLPMPRSEKPMSLSVGGPVDEIRREARQLVELLNESVAPFRAALARK